MFKNISQLQQFTGSFTFRGDITLSRGKKIHLFIIRILKQNRIYMVDFWDTLEGLVYQKNPILFKNMEGDQKIKNHQRNADFFHL